MSKSITEKTGDDKTHFGAFFLLRVAYRNIQPQGSYFAYLFSLDKFLFFSSLQRMSV